MWRETRRGGGVCSWLPEQQFIGLVLLPALLLWQVRAVCDACTCARVLWALSERWT